MKGIDCASPVSTDYATQIKANGISFIGRYLGRTSKNPGKILQSSELKNITESGLWVLSIFEWYADRTKEGAVAGKADGQWSNDRAKILGQPTGSAIFACVDYDTSRPDLEWTEEYLRAFASEIPDYRLGVYAEYDVVDAMFVRGVIDVAWQCKAWSGGKIHPKAALYQEWIDKPMFGKNVDSNILYTDPVSAGLWGQAIPEEEDPVLKEQIAKLEERVAQLEAERDVQTPEWGKDAMDKAVAKFKIDPNGSITWKRVIELFKRAGLLK